MKSRGRISFNWLSMEHVGLSKIATLGRTNVDSHLTEPLGKSLQSNGDQQVIDHTTHTKSGTRYNVDRSWTKMTRSVI
jgi:hypothetical protein